jgi:hypothetical protein
LSCQGNELDGRRDPVYGSPVSVVADEVEGFVGKGIRVPKKLKTLVPTAASSRPKTWFQWSCLLVHGNVATPPSTISSRLTSARGCIADQPNDMASAHFIS